jgi:hypothetical protein
MLEHIGVVTCVEGVAVAEHESLLVGASKTAILPSEAPGPLSAAISSNEKAAPL